MKAHQKQTKRPSMLVLLAMGLVCVQNGQAVTVESQSQASVRSSLQTNLKSFLKSDQMQQQKSQMGSEQSLQELLLQKSHKKNQKNSLNLAQSASSEGLEQQLLLALGSGNVQTQEMSQEDESSALAQTGEAETALPANISPEILAQAQAEAEAQVAAEQQAAGAGAAGAAVAAAPAEVATAQVDASTQAAAEAQALAEAQAQVEAQAQAAPKSTTKTMKIAVPNSPEINQAAAVLAAAEARMPDDKPWAKMSAAERTVKTAKDAAEKDRLAKKAELENPTVDADGNHIQTVAEAKLEARELQAMLVQGEAAVEQKIQMQQEQLANEPAMPAEPVKQEEDDGHIQTVEEAKAEMAAAQAKMEAGIAATDHKVEAMNAESANMPNFGALADATSTLGNMGKMRKKGQVNSLAAKLGVEVEAGDYDLEAAELGTALMARAKTAGKTDAEINAAMAE